MKKFPKNTYSTNSSYNNIPLQLTFHRIDLIINNAKNNNNDTNKNKEIKGKYTYNLKTKNKILIIKIK